MLIASCKQIEVSYSAESVAFLIFHPVHPVRSYWVTQPMTAHCFFCCGRHFLCLPSICFVQLRFDDLPLSPLTNLLAAQQNIICKLGLREREKERGEEEGDAVKCVELVLATNMLDWWQIDAVTDWLSDWLTDWLSEWVTDKLQYNNLPLSWQRQQ